MSTVAELEERFPQIPWREPIQISRTDGVSGFACRVCIAERGLRADEIQSLYRNAEAAQRHIDREHP